MPAESLKTSLFGHGELAGLLGARFNSVRLVFEPEHVAAAALLRENAGCHGSRMLSIRPDRLHVTGEMEKREAGTGRVEQV